MIGGHAPRACPPIIYQPGLTIQATLTNADYAGNVSLTEIVPDFGRHLRKCPMLSALAGRWCGSAAPRTLRDGVGQCAARIGPHHPSEPASAAGASLQWGRKSDTFLIKALSTGDDLPSPRIKKGF